MMTVGVDDVMSVAIDEKDQTGMCDDRSLKVAGGVKCLESALERRCFARLT